MRQRFDVLINTVSMASLANEIIVRDIVEQPEETDVETVLRGNRPGMRVTSRVRKSLSVQVVYMIRTRNVVRRTEVRNKIAAWCAKGGILEINTRPGKRLYVKPNALPSVNSALKWTQDLSLTFVAYEQPYWEDKTIVQDTGSLTKLDSGEYWLHRLIHPVGDVDFVPMQAYITVTGTAPLTWLKLVCGDTMFELEGMNIANGGMVVILYDENDRLNVVDFTNDQASLLSHRTPQSSDDLLCRTGVDNNWSLEANTPLYIELFTRGRWF